MKFILFTLLSVFCITTHAQERVLTKTLTEDVNTPAPKFLEGATIVVKTKDGKEYKMQASAFKVVPRKQQFKVVEKDYSTTVHEQVSVPEYKKNIVSVGGGAGPSQNLNFSQSGTTESVNTREVPVGSLQYQRLLNERWSLGVQGMTNSSVLLNVGYGF